MTLEAEVAALTVATTNLLEAVNVRKAALDDAVDSVNGAGAAAVAAHVAQSDPHTQYITASAVDSATASAISNHLAQSDPHPQYFTEDDVAGLFAAQLPTLGTAASKDAPATGNASADQVVLGSDTRLSDARTPTTHTHTASQISDSTASGRALLTAADAAAQRTLLNVANGATANATDAQLRDRATHTGSQSSLTISDFNAAVDSRISSAVRLANPIISINHYGAKRISNRTGYGVSTTQAVSPGWLYIHHFEPNSRESATGMGIEITASAAANMMLGLWRVHDTNFLALVGQVGPIDISTTGFKTASFATPILLTERDYFISMSVDADGAYTRAESAMRGALSFQAGQENASEFYVSNTYSTTLPNLLLVSVPSGHRIVRGRAFLTGV